MHLSFCPVSRLLSRNKMKQINSSADYNGKTTKRSHFRKEDLTSVSSRMSSLLPETVSWWSARKNALVLKMRGTGKKSFLSSFLPLERFSSVQQTQFCGKSSGLDFISGMKVLQLLLVPPTGVYEQSFNRDTKTLNAMPMLIHCMLPSVTEGLVSAVTLLWFVFSIEFSIHFLSYEYNIVPLLRAEGLRMVGL